MSATVVLSNLRLIEQASIDGKIGYSKNSIQVQLAQYKCFRAYFEASHVAHAKESNLESKDQKVIHCSPASQCQRVDCNSTSKYHSKPNREASSIVLEPKVPSDTLVHLRLSLNASGGENNFL